MPAYTVHEPPLREAKSVGEAAPDPERFVFVRDGFHFWAFLLGPLWMLAHRMWLVLVLYLIYLDQGISLWFLIHLVTAVLVWVGSGSYHSRRRHRNNY